MLSNLSGWHFIVILFIVLLLFGAPKLPALARSVGQSMKIFKAEIRSDPPAADAAPEAGTTFSAGAAPSANTAPSDKAAPSGNAATSHSAAAPTNAPGVKPAP